MAGDNVLTIKLCLILLCGLAVEKATAGGLTTTSLHLQANQTWCYNCMDLDNQSLCREAKNLLNKQQEIRQMTVAERLNFTVAYGAENCGTWASHCITMHVISGATNSTKYYRRRCMTVNDLSVVPYPDGSTSQRSFVPSLRADNQTLCEPARPGQDYMCMTLCTGQDFCNGPQPGAAAPAVGFTTPSPRLQANQTWCYNCMDLPNQSLCREVKDLLNKQQKIRQMTVAERLNFKGYGAENCGSWASHCVIEHVISGATNSTKYYRRRCSTGSDFSVAAYPDGSMAQWSSVSSLRADNQTSCESVGPGQDTVCITLCTGRDFCNGPAPGTATHTSSSGPSGASGQTPPNHKVSLSPELDGNWCYSCMDLQSDQTWCKGANNLLSNQGALRKMSEIDRIMHRGYGLQSCGDYFPFCVIMELIEAGGSSPDAKYIYSRECSDGRQFSHTFSDGQLFNLNTSASRLGSFLSTHLGRASSNRTICQMQGQFQVCISVCSGDFCNGPQYREVMDINSSTSITSRFVEKLTLCLLTLIGVQVLRLD